MSEPPFVYLDETPGETRGVIYNEGWQYLLSQFEAEDPQERLGARSVGRVERIEPGLGGAFIDLGRRPGAKAFLPVSGGTRLHQGQKIEVEVASERRESKGVTLKLVGKAEGDPRLLKPGPSVREWLSRLAPGVTPTEGVEAIDAGWRALSEAMAQPTPSFGPIVKVERTQAMVAVDFDHRPLPGRTTPRDRLEANKLGLKTTARTLRLRALGGLVAIDLVGVGHDGGALMKAARTEFGGDPDVVFGPINRFGVMMLSLPWRFQPLAERLFRGGAADWWLPPAGAVEATRRLRHHLLTDTATPRFTVRCTGSAAKIAEPLVARLGPRARVIGDDSLRSSEFVIEAE